MKKEKFIDKWQKVKRQGKIKYVHTNSTTIGITMFCGFLLNKLMKGDTLDKKLEFNRGFGILFGGLIGGAIGGMISWHSKEKKFNRLINK